MERANKALQRTRPVRSGCNPRGPRAGLLSFGRWATRFRKQQHDKSKHRISSTGRYRSVLLGTGRPIHLPGHRRPNQRCLFHHGSNHTSRRRAAAAHSPPRGRKLLPARRHSRHHAGREKAQGHDRRLRANPSRNGPRISQRREHDSQQPANPAGARGEDPREKVEKPSHKCAANWPSRSVVLLGSCERRS